MFLTGFTPVLQVQATRMSSGPAEFASFERLVLLERAIKVVFTCSSDSWEMWFTAAYDSILGLKWLMMALEHKKKQTCLT